MGKLSDFNNKSFSNGKNERVTEENLQKKYDYYKNMNSADLNSELLKEVGKQKMAGTFDYQKLESMVESLKGSLPEENYNNIKKILEGLK